MKKTLIVALMLLIAGSAFAATPKPVKCKENGKIKHVATVEDCTKAGGVVVEPKVAKKA